jgi:hypothetical protein
MKAFGCHDPTKYIIIVAKWKGANPSSMSLRATEQEHECECAEHMAGKSTIFVI